MANWGMAGGASFRDGRINLRYLPDAKKLYTTRFDRLDGGLNLYDLEYRLATNESPDMKNLRWKEGALSCRAGQQMLIEGSAGDVGYSSFDMLFWGYAFVHIGGKIICFDPNNAPYAYTVLKTGVPTNRGTWFRYGDYLMYKNRGGYYRIGYDPGGQTVNYMFPVETPDDDELIPITYINVDPTTHAGAAYQPENRLSAKKEVWYNAAQGVTDYSIPYGTDNAHISAVEKVTVDGAVLRQVQSNPGEGEYSVEISDTYKTAVIHFHDAPPVHDPVQNNTVKVIYTTTGTDVTNARNAIMDCPYAIVFGGDQNLCVVLGGCTAQPNAYFWCGNDQYSMNPFYFPMEQYNFAGDTESAVTGFGKQQGFLVIFSHLGVGKATFGTTTTTSERLAIEMPYTAINSKIGCDYPWSIELVDNNLVFFSREHGVCYLADTSPADENNIVEISRKINGTGSHIGLLHDADDAGTDGVHSTVFDDCFWIVANETAYVWDFRLSGFSDPVWFRFTAIKGISFFNDSVELYHLDPDGNTSVFKEGIFNDYGDPIEKVYQFATQSMGGFDRLKNVVSIILVVKSETNTVTQVKYITDYEERYDLTPIRSFHFSLTPRDLSFRFLGVSPFGVVQRRMPMCRHVRFFALRLENNETDQDLSVVTAEMQFNYQGRQK